MLHVSCFVVYDFNIYNNNTVVLQYNSHKEIYYYIYNILIHDTHDTSLKNANAHFTNKMISTM